ncbi:copper resistance protein NlpE N-terminal domain-containing protein [Chromohalobacter sarecensis]|uniref:Copper resistance protein NlpE N-terminal domain-containing protein n=1 Tax=Chromohalobacter sarecensis TaxID=245294 RepID=A0ABV9D3E1_9GAMM|nr:copper resistance protein NlpE N-terminal domain-containing protein [Chromohalobacter sarecensis]MCK0714553.1 copper resistance protein NlpE [Chromohalobacter sarecensis]
MRWHLPILISLTLTACAGTPQSQVEYVPSTEKFEGTLPCGDCSGIDTTLVLKRDAITGEPRSFYLHQTRIDAPGSERVDTSWGNWSKSRDVSDFERRIYVLQPEVGAAHVYIPLENGDLQPLGAQGAPLNDDNDKDITLQRMTPSLHLPTRATE